MAGKGKKESTGKGRVKVKKLTLNKETVKALTTSEAKGVRGGLRAGGAGGKGGDPPPKCGDTSTILSTCTKVDTGTKIPTASERC